MISNNGNAKTLQGNKLSSLPLSAFTTGAYIMAKEIMPDVWGWVVTEFEDDSYNDSYIAGKKIDLNTFSKTQEGLINKGEKNSYSF